MRLLLVLLLTTIVQAAEWTFDEFRNPDLTPFSEIGGPTVIEQGPDLRFYVGAKGWVYALDVDDNYIVRSVCRSESIGEDRTVLGIAFEPRKFEADDVYFYIATSTLDWGGGQFGDPEAVPGGWKNGMVQVMRANVGESCLAVTKNLVTGLSVSNHNHGVNGMVVGMNGKLYVQNGGMTNAGHSEKGDGDGGSPATPLSAALLEVNYNKADFVGDVIYDSNDGRIANISNSPDVKVFAAGFLNALPIVLHTNNGLYTVDNGPNPGYGKESTSCTTNLESEPYTQDKFIRIVKNGWFGHPNRNRGRFDARQCKFQAIGSTEDGVIAPLAQVESSTNGLVEYASGKLGRGYKGAMMLCRIGFGEPGNSYALFLDDDGKTVRRREEIGAEGGLWLSMDRWGNLVSTEYIGGRIRVMKAAVEGVMKEAGVRIYSVIPRRGPAEGGNWVAITGRFRGDGVIVMVGSRFCADVDRVDDGLIRCRVPRGRAMSKVEISVQVGGRWSPSLGTDYTYMRRKVNGGLAEHML